MFGEDFMRDFFGLDRPSRSYGYTSLTGSFGREVVDKALELSKGQPPEANLMPYIQIVMDARKLRLKVMRDSDSP